MPENKVYVTSKTFETKQFDYQQLNQKTREQIQELTIDIKNKLRRCAQDIVEIGDNLCKIKKQLQHGQFRSWLKTEFDWSISTANKFMQVSQMFKIEELQEVEIAPSALYVLAAPSTPETVRYQALNRARQGENISYSLAKKLVKEHKIVEEDEQSIIDINFLEVSQNLVIVEETRLSPIQAQENNSDFVALMYNLSDFNYHLEQEWRRMTREKRDLSLILCQISFKETNQSSALIAQMIQQIAEGLTHILKRPGDFAGEYKNNQWAAVLPNTYGEGARVVGQRFLNWFLSWEDDLILASDNFIFPLSVHLGIATTIPNNQNYYHDLINTAQRALLEAQNQGENQMVIKEDNF
ncbi:diguanylate cyclase domain-containing protein [Crocosphaera sp. XPORK-15E]|uniref:diguanylate cyclase domain-containing protein n=1 Tax=Crocosphaera sp. XPORK-15E TaxID=3110247 RepID=UPI002B1F8C20|nr:diguanylate cyclase [Crocosphaera sp. XPORK-15E]MEA5536359.1 diguanylate cyclase [Crocosphaera sp. XPORK-15E]